MAITVANDVIVTGDLTVGGNLVIPNISTTGDLAVGDDLTVTGDTTFTTPVISVAGEPLAQYKRLSFKGDEFRADPAAIATKGDTINYPGWDFADGSTQAVQLSWAPPQIAHGAAIDFWTTCSLALVWINLSAAAGNVVWQTEVRKLAIGIDAVDEAAFLTVNEAKVAAGIKVMNAFKFVTLLNLTPDFFGTEWSMRISRIGADAADTLAGAVRLGVCSLNQVS